MGKISGGLYGKVGRLVLFSSGDQQMVRIKADDPTKFSPAQLANQGKFKTMMRQNCCKNVNTGCLLLKNKFCPS